jgi:hypothetical protein
MTTHSLALASRAPCDTKTLARAARDFGEKEPAFAIGAGLLALHWLVQGYGYESPAPTCGTPTARRWPLPNGEAKAPR